MAGTVAKAEVCLLSPVASQTAQQTTCCQIRPICGLRTCRGLVAWRQVLNKLAASPSSGKLRGNECNGFWAKCNATQVTADTAQRLSYFLRNEARRSAVPAVPQPMVERNRSSDWSSFASGHPLRKNRSCFCLLAEHRKKPQALLQHFLPRDASAERGDEIACRLSVRLSVCNV